MTQKPLPPGVGRKKIAAPGFTPKVDPSFDSTTLIKRFDAIKDLYAGKSLAGSAVKGGDRASRVNDTPPKPLGSVAKIAGMTKGMAGIARKPMGGTSGSKTGIGIMGTPGQGRSIKQLTPGQGRSLKGLGSVGPLGSAVKGIASTGKSVGKSLGSVGRGITRMFEKGGGVKKTAAKGKK